MVPEESKSPPRRDSVKGRSASQRGGEYAQMLGSQEVKKAAMHDANPDGAKLITDLKDCAEGGEIGVNDSVIFNAAMLKNDEEKIAAVFVGDPVELNGKINFTVRAFDADGDFEIQRRFTEFEALRKSLAIRLSGLYVPKLPKSSFFGDSKDLKFLQERSFHLE